MSTLRPCVFVEKRSDKRIAEGIFRPYAVEVVGGLTTSGAIGFATVSLLEHPERPIAVVLNAETEDPEVVERTRATVKRLLAGTAAEGWYVALALPGLEAWALTDPRVKREVDSHLDGKASYTDRVDRIRRVLKAQPFDATELLRKSTDFKGLVGFLRECSSVPPALADELSPS